MLEMENKIDNQMENQMLIDNPYLDPLKSIILSLLEPFKFNTYKKSLETVLKTESLDNEILKSAESLIEENENIDLLIITIQSIILQELSDDDENVSRTSQLLDLVYILVKKDSTLVFYILEKIFDLHSVEWCGKFWDFLTLRKKFLCHGLVGNTKPGTILIRLSNKLLKRLSKNRDSELKAKVLFLLVNAFPLEEKSGQNKAGDFNTDNVTIYDETLKYEPFKKSNKNKYANSIQRLKMIIPQISSQFSEVYSEFWSLQKYLNNPTEILSRPELFPVFEEKIRFVLDTLLLHDDYDGNNDVSDSEDSDYEEDSDHVSTKEKNSNSELNQSIKDDSKIKFTSYIPKWLTAKELLELELKDRRFRQAIIIQIAIVLEFFLTLSKDGRADWPKDVKDLFQTNGPVYIHANNNFKNRNIKTKAGVWSWGVITIPHKEEHKLYNLWLRIVKPSCSNDAHVRELSLRKSSQSKFGTITEKIASDLREILLNEHQWVLWKLKGCPSYGIGQNSLLKNDSIFSSNENYKLNDSQDFDEQIIHPKPTASSALIGSFSSVDENNSPWSKVSKMGDGNIAKVWEEHIDLENLSNDSKRYTVPPGENLFEAFRLMARDAENDQYCRDHAPQYSWLALRAAREQKPYSLFTQNGLFGMYNSSSEDFPMLTAITQDDMETEDDLTTSKYIVSFELKDPDFVQRSPTPEPVKPPESSLSSNTTDNITTVGKKPVDTHSNSSRGSNSSSSGSTTGKINNSNKADNRGLANNNRNRNAHMSSGVQSGGANRTGNNASYKHGSNNNTQAWEASIPTGPRDTLKSDYNSGGMSNQGYFRNYQDEKGHGSRNTNYYNDNNNNNNNNNNIGTRYDRDKDRYGHPVDQSYRNIVRYDDSRQYSAHGQNKMTSNTSFHNTENSKSGSTNNIPSSNDKVASGRVKLTRHVDGDSKKGGLGVGRNVDKNLGNIPNKNSYNNGPNYMGQNRNNNLKADQTKDNSNKFQGSNLNSNVMVNNPNSNNGQAASKNNSQDGLNNMNGDNYNPRSDVNSRNNNSRGKPYEYNNNIISNNNNNNYNSNYNYNGYNNNYNGNYNYDHYDDNYMNDFNDINESTYNNYKSNDYDGVYNLPSGERPLRNNPNNHLMRNNRDSARREWDEGKSKGPQLSNETYKGWDEDSNSSSNYSNSSGGQRRAHNFSNDREREYKRRRNNLR